MRAGKKSRVIGSAIWSLAIVGALAAPAAAGSGNFVVSGLDCVSKNPDQPDLAYYSNGAVVNEDTDSRTVLCPLPMGNGTWNTGDTLGVTISGDEGSSGANITCTLRVSGDYGNSLQATVSDDLVPVGSGFQLGISVTETLNYTSQHASAHVSCVLPPDSGSNKSRIYQIRGQFNL